MTRTVARFLAAALAALIPFGSAAAQEGAAATEVPDDVIIRQPDPPPPQAPPPGDGPLVPEGGVPVVGMPLAPQPAPAPAPAPPPRPEPPPIPPPQYSLELQIRAAFPEESSFDLAMGSFGYSGVRIEPVVYVGIQIPVVEWLWLGGRFGMRGRHWTHPDRESAVVTAGDVLGTVQVRLALGRVVELGVLLGGGAGLVLLQVNGVATDQVVGRFQVEAMAAFRVGPHFALGPRVGWGYFQWEGMNRYDHGVDLGGPYLGLALEARE